MFDTNTNGLDMEDKRTILSCLGYFSEVVYKESERRILKSVYDHLKIEGLIRAGDIPFIRFVMQWAIDKYIENIAKAEANNIPDKAILLTSFRSNIQIISNVLQKI
jgi:hypothetical protein